MDGSDERGVVSLVGLCVLMVVLLFGLALAHFVHSGGAVAAEYEREMQLRLAAESGVETAAARLEASASAYGVPPDRGTHRQVTIDRIPMADGIEVSVFIEPPSEHAPAGTLEVAAVARDVSARMPDGGTWQRAKIVRARLEKKGERYVWRRWF